jgi:serine phosphatase RsbU (regulator of sigma subunit)
MWEQPPAAPTSAGAHRARPTLIALDLVLGVIPASLMAFLFEQVDDLSRYRPASVLLLTITGLGLLRGRWAAGSAAVAATGVVWWFLTPRERSFRFGDGSDALSLAVFVATEVGVFLLLVRVERARSRNAEARARAEALLDLVQAEAGASTAAETAGQVVAALSGSLGCRSVFVAFGADAVAGSASVVAVGGYPDDGAHAWTGAALEPAGEGPLGTAVRTGDLCVARLHVDHEGQWEELRRHRAAGDVTVAWQPVLDVGSGTAIAAVAVGWPTARPVPETVRTLVQTVASIAGLALARIAADEAAERDRFRSAMDAMIDQVVLAHAIRGDDGAIVDFEVDFANEAALTATGRTLPELVGRRAGDLYPRWQASGLLERFATVVETGVPYVAERVPYHDRARDGRETDAFWNIQVVKVGDGYISASRDVTEMVEAERLAEEARAAAERERIAIELLQRAALPSTLPRTDGLDLGAQYRPAAARQPVGGDWYDAFALDGDTVALVIADVAGHGEEAAAFMLQVRSIFRAVALEHRDPGEVLAQVDRVLGRIESDPHPFVTCCYATIAPATGDLRWALAGHPPPLVVEPDGSAWFGSVAAGPPLASVPSRPPDSGRATLSPGASVVLFTDGLVERRGEDLDHGLERLRGIAATATDLGAEEQARRLADSVDAPEDDLAILCAHIAPPPPPPRG